MSPLQVLTVALAATVAGALGAPPHTLEEAAHKLDMVINNTRSRENYIRCFMDRGICNKEASGIKRILADALATNCSNCTQIQRLGVDKFFQYLQSHQPDTWVSLTEKYRRTNGEKKKHHDDDDETDDDDDDDDDDHKGGKKKSGKKKKGKGDHEGSGGNQTVNHNSSQMSSENDPVVNSTAISLIF